MYGDEQKFLAWIESLQAHYGHDATDDFRADVLGKLGRMERKRSQDIRDMEAAKLLPSGADKVVELQGCHLSTVYRRASRAEILARKMHAATNRA